MVDHRPSTPEWEEEIFSAALELPPGGSREAFLKQRCGADVELCRRLSALLAAYQASDGFLDDAAYCGRHEFVEGEWERIGDRIRSYTLVRRIGEGGYGVVYLAEQRAPIRREVALKVLKPGLDTRAILARFEAERQVLALLDHRSIARIVEAGSTPRGTPFYAMEFVDGSRVTEYCAQRNLGVRERIELIVEICHAIEHAHQKGIIHRDLKPSNILVIEQQGKAVPKVIDFGIAKATSVAAGPHTLTIPGQLLGTPAYMSAEQLESGGTDVDTRSDVYSLGVILYELLTGVVPFKPLKDETVESFRLRTTQLDARKPSAIVASGKSGSTSLGANLRGDLDAIVLKALARDRQMRYRSAADLADDLRRFLRNEPVEARTPGPFYRASKFVRRHKTLSGAVGLVLIVVLAAGGLILSSWRNEQKALRAAAQASEDLRLNLYCADMQLVSQAYASEDLGRMRELLKAHEQMNPPVEWRLFSHLARGAEVWSKPVTLPKVAGGGFLDAARIIAVANGQGSVFEMRNVKDGSLIESFGRSPELALGCLLSPDATKMAVERLSGPCELWDLGRREIIWRGPAQPLRFAFHPAQPLLAVLQKRSADEATVSIYDFATGEVKQQFGFRASALDFSPDGTRLVLTDRLGTTAVWDWKTREEVSRFAARHDDLHLLRIAPDRPIMARASSCCGFDVWNYETGEKLVHCLNVGFSIAWLSFSRDGKFLAASSADQAVTIWETQDWKMVRRLIGHGNGARFAEFAPDGDTLLTGAEDGHLRFWASKERKEGDDLGALWFAGNCFSADSRRVAGFRLDGSVEVWEVQPQRMISKTRMDPYPVTIGFSSEKAVWLWDRTLPGKLSLCEWHYLDDAAPEPLKTWTVTAGEFGAVSASAGLIVVAANDVYELSYLRNGSVRQLETIPLKSRPEIRQGAFSRDLSLVTFAVSETQFGLWETQSGKLRRGFEYPGVGITAVAVSADGTMVAASGSHHEAYVWDAGTGKLLRTLQGNRAEVYGISFAPDSKTAITSGGDQTIRFFNLATGRMVGCLQSRMWVDRTILSPNENFLVTMERFQPRIWELAPR